MFINQSLLSLITTINTCMLIKRFNWMDIVDVSRMEARSIIHINLQLNTCRGVARTFKGNSIETNNYGSREV